MSTQEKQGRRLLEVLRGIDDEGLMTREAMRQALPAGLRSLAARFDS